MRAIGLDCRPLTSQTPATVNRVGRSLSGALLTLGSLVLSAPGAAMPTSSLDFAAAREAAQAFVSDERGVCGLVLVMLRDGRTEYAFLGPLFDGAPPGPEAVRFEIGSITKTLTAWLAAEMVAAGEVAWETPLGELVPPGLALTASLAAVTLADLARHRGGLPRLSPRWWENLLNVLLSPADPYRGQTPERLWAMLAAVGEVPPPEARVARYSNLGSALLGQALARRAGQDFDTLIEKRLLAPHGLAGMRMARRDRPDPRLLPGTGATGLAATPWHLEGFGPAGGLIASPADMAAYVGLLLDPPPAFAELLARPPELGPEQSSVSGLGFQHRLLGERHVRWHNGGTGGFRSFVAAIPEEGVAVVLLGSTNVMLDPLGWHILDPARPKPEAERRWPRMLLTIAVLPGVPLLLAALAWQGLPPRPGKPLPDRLQLGSTLLGLLVLLAAMRGLGDFTWLPPATWWAAALPSLALALFALIRHAPALPWSTRGFGTNLGRALSVALLLLVGAMFLRG